jgi:hypothetical protein
MRRRNGYHVIAAATEISSDCEDLESPSRKYLKTLSMALNSCAVILSTEALPGRPAGARHAARKSVVEIDMTGPKISRSGRPGKLLEKIPMILVTYTPLPVSRLGAIKGQDTRVGGNVD